MPSARVLAVSCGAIAAVALAGCHGADQPAGGKSAAPSPAAIDSPAAQGVIGQAAANSARPGMVVTGARLVLPVIPGRPGAVYFTLRNDSPAPATLVSVQIEGAGKVAMHRTQGGSMSAVGKLRVMPGGSLDFMPGGLHAMVFDLDTSLKPGGASRLTLTFADGSKVAAPLAVEAMGAKPAGGDAMGSMADMPAMAGHDPQGMQH